MLNCDSKIKLANNLSLNSILTIVQVEIYSNNIKTLTNNVKFAIYDENKNKLNLSVYKDEKVIINYKLKSIESIISKIHEYLLIDIDILNIESPPFNDICWGQIIVNGKDLNLGDRIEKLYLNYSECDINCQYDKTNIQKRIISCNCTSLLNIESKIEEPTFKQKYLSYFQDSSLIL